VAERVRFELHVPELPDHPISSRAVMTVRYSPRDEPFEIRAAPLGARILASDDQSQGAEKPDGRRGFVALAIAALGASLRLPPPRSHPKPRIPPRKAPDPARPPAPPPGGGFPWPHRDPPAAPAGALRGGRSRDRTQLAHARRLGYQESRWRPAAVSPRGAQGVMMLMPVTAKKMGVSNVFSPTRTFSAEQNTLRT